MKLQNRQLLTGAIVLFATLVVLIKYWDYLANPWTRDGQVRAEVIQVAPNVSGTIVDLPIRDNQFVEAGDLLFEIDPRIYAASLVQANANLESTGNDVTVLENKVQAAEAGITSSRASISQAQALIDEAEATIAQKKAEYDRQIELMPQGATSEKAVQQAKAAYEVSLGKLRSDQAGLAKANATLIESEASLAEALAQLGALGDANPQIRAAMASVRLAELNMEFTKVTAPVSGYVTNLNLRIGSNAVANQPALALVDTDSYWIDAFFKENVIAGIESGDEAVVTLMSYPDTPLKARVDSIGWGIALSDGSTGFELLPTVSPTFEWIRLAQRVPVRVHLEDVPDHINLRVGTTASVLVRK